MKTKKIILSVFTLCCSVVAQAQNEVVGAILQTGDNVTMYYGVNALKDAYAAAETGSVITLTAGTFNNPGTITKSVSIYGVGFENNQVTTINGTLTIQSSSVETMLDGVRIDGVNLSYIIYVQRVKNLVVSNSKCNSYFTVYGDNVQNVTVKQCYIIGNITGTAKVDGLLFQNCYITGQNQYDNAEGRIQIDHCILTYNESTAHFRALYTNNIINSSKGVDAGSTAQNNIFLNKASLNTSSVLSYGNWFKPTLNTLFTDGTDLTYSVARTFTLSSPETYVGTDGTPVGINGAGHTWKNRASTPIINSLTLGVSGSTINVTYDAETRNP